MLLAPAKTPRAVLHKIAKDVARVLELPDVKKQMDAMAFVPAPTTPEEYDRSSRHSSSRSSGLRARPD